MNSKTIYSFEGQTFDTLKAFYDWVAKNVVHGSMEIEGLIDSYSHEYDTIYLPSKEVEDFNDSCLAISYSAFEAQFSEYFYNDGDLISEGRMIYDSEEIDKEQALYFFIAVIAEEHLKLVDNIEYTPKQIYGLYKGKKYVAPCYVESNNPVIIKYLNGKTEPLPEGCELKSVSLTNSNR